jgi:hypothetical protein
VGRTLGSKTSRFSYIIETETDNKGIPEAYQLDNIMATNKGDEPVNYPDLLGLITNGKRLNIDVIQCAISTRPPKISAGQSFEVLLLIQNATDAALDITVNIKLPDRDAANQKDRFVSKRSRLLVGLHAAEVGYMHLPVACAPNTKPAHGYEIALEVKVDRHDKSQKPGRVRLPDGGGSMTLTALSADARSSIEQLHGLIWDVEGGKRNTIVGTFDVGPPGLASLTSPEVGWSTLWTMADHLDDRALEARVRPHLEVIMPTLTDKQAMAMPLLQATNHWFNEAGYALQPVEAVYIAKIMTLVLTELSIPKPTKLNPNPEFPQWYRTLLHLLWQESGFRDYAVALVKDNLYPDLIADSIIYGFRMLSTVLADEDFGTDEEVREYAAEISHYLRDQMRFDYHHVYLPLILAGVIANARVVFERENVRDTLNAISQAHDSRRAEQNSDNAFIGEILHKLIDRALDHF